MASKSVLKTLPGRTVLAPGGVKAKVAYVVKRIVILETGKAYHVSRIRLCKEK